MKKTTFILLALSALFLITCKKAPELKVYELTLDHENVAYSQTSAEIKVDYTYPSSLRYVNVTLSQSNYFGYSIVAQAEVKDSVFIANFVDLQTNKNYYYKYEYSNGINTITSDVRSFYLDASQITLPTVVTKQVTSIGSTSAECGGEITSDGGHMVTARGVCWSTHRNPTIYDTYTTNGMGTGEYSSTLSGLEMGTTYYVRAYAINEKGTSYGTEVSFDTESGTVSVSTEPSNRNVIIEEFTGRDCGYCTDGHRLVNQIMANNPGRVWGINLHAGGYALTSYPNMNTTDGTSIHDGFSVSGYPSGVVNRTTSAAIDRGQWSSECTTQLSQAAECNIAGIAKVNPNRRTANITVKVYYTDNSSANQNFLTVAMLQDSILGSQADYGNYNPTQWLNGEYVHLHILRDVITDNAWGDAISPTTTGTLITKTYEYQIPEVIGNPNGVDVDINNIYFLAWVAQGQMSSTTRQILNACKLELIYE